ncbi:MAG: hypothetical protein JWM46_634 [Candidatus Kaiserbacteria bacterium]|nr:hypothetical protein [Candidatus Kaiserbacteria bacterium]
MNTSRSLVLSVTLLAGLLLSGSASAWTGPTASPPSANVSAPLNVSTADQLKHGWIGLDSLSIFDHMIISGAVNSPNTVRYLNFGSTWDAAGYGIRDNAGTLEFKNSGGSWTSLQSTIYNYCADEGCGGSTPDWTNITGKPFNWAGQTGQPSWLWGSNDGVDYYVWNPSNFNVNYANSAGAVPWSGVSGKPFNWNGQSGQPSWLWGSNDGANYYVWNPSNFNVASVGGYGAEGLLKYDTWGRGSTYYASNGDSYLAWRGQWLSTIVDNLPGRLGGQFWVGQVEGGYNACPSGSIMVGTNLWLSYYFGGEPEMHITPYTNVLCQWISQ